MLASVKLALLRHQLADGAAIVAENNVERSAMARYSAEEKQEVHAAFEAILDQLDALERQPDSWEESYLVHALSYMGAGIYNRAKTELRECVTPIAERSTWRAAQLERNPPRYKVARLRLRLNQLKAEARQR